MCTYFWHKLWYSYKKWQKIIYSKLGRLNVYTFCTKRPDRTVKTQIRGVCGFDGGPMAHSPFPHDTPLLRHTNESTPTRLGFIPLGINCCQKREGLTNLPPTAGSTPRISITTRFPPRSVCPHLSGKERRCGDILHLNADATRYLYTLTTWWYTVNAWKPTFQNACVQ